MLTGPQKQQEWQAKPGPPFSCIFACLLAESPIFRPLAGATQHVGPEAGQVGGRAGYGVQSAFSDLLHVVSWEETLLAM